MSAPVKGQRLSSGKTPPPTQRWQAPVICLVLVAMTWAVFGQTVRFGFVNYDDGKYVYENPMVRKGLTWEGARWALSYSEIGPWHPLTWLMGEWAAKWHVPRVVTGGLMAAVLVALIICAGKQAAYWKDSETLFARALVCTRDNYHALFNLGAALASQGRLDEAMGYYQKALEIKPVHAEPCFNLGKILAQTGRVDDAIVQFQNALQIRPDYKEAHVTLASALLRKAQLDEAIAHCQSVLQINPDNAAAHFNLGLAFSQKGKEDQALAEFQKALQMQPDSPLFLNRVAWIMATSQQALLRNGAEATRLARRANDLSGGQNPALLATLAAALAEARQLSDAILTARKAIALAQSEGQQALAQQLTTQLQRYQAGLPYRN